MAVANYREHYGSYPPAFVAGPDGRPWHSWRVLLLPFMEYRELHAEYDFKEPWDGPNNSKLLQKAPRHYAFDGAPIGDGVANYLAVVGSETIWPGAAARKPEEIADSPDETILVVENRGADVKWTEPRDLALSAFNHRIFGPDAIDSAYDDSAVVMLGGRLQKLSANVDPAAVRAALTIAGGEKLELDAANGWQVLKDGRDRPRKSIGSESKPESP